MTEEKTSGLSQESTLKELFDFIAVNEGVNVMPVKIKQDEHDTRLLIVIQGHRDTASVILAQLMTVIQDMFDTSEQAEVERDKPRIVLPGT